MKFPHDAPQRKVLKTLDARHSRSPIAGKRLSKPGSRSASSPIGSSTWIVVRSAFLLCLATLNGIDRSALATR